MVNSAIYVYSAILYYPDSGIPFLPFQHYTFIFPLAPNLRFPEFNGEWESCTYNDLFDTISERNTNKGLTNVLSASQADGMTPRNSLGIDIKFDKESIKNYKIVRSGDYVIHLRSFQGGFAFSELLGICSPAYTILRPKALLQYGFLKSFFMSRKFIDSLRVVTYGIRDGKSISVDEWLKLRLFIPGSSEQRKVTKFLEFIAEKIKTQSEIIEDLYKLKRAIVEKSYSGNRKSVKIGKIIRQVSQRNKALKYTTVLSVSNKMGFVSQSEQFEDRAVASDDISNYKIVSPDDFAYNPARINVGSVARLKSKSCGVVSPMYVCFHTTEEIIPQYLEHYFTTRRFKNEMQKRLVGSVRMCLSFEDLCDIQIPLPPIAEQKLLAQRIETLSQKISLEEKIKCAYMRQKQYLLQHLFI